MTTIADVALAADVSTSTVSRYLSGKLKVSPSVESRIRSAVDALGYVPHAGARLLAGRRSGVIGLVIPGLSNPFFAQLADEVVEAASGHGLTMLLCPTRNDREREAQYADLLAAQAADGLLYVGAHSSNASLAKVVHGGLPVVVLDEPLVELPPVPTVTVDNFGGGFQATTYLTALGHRRIAYIGGPAELGTDRERRRGYLEALQKAGIEPDPELIFTGAYSKSFGVSVLPHLTTRTNAPSAVFCASDYTALGLIHAAQRSGLRVPHDLSVVGFDDIDVAGHLQPALSTIRQPVAMLAVEAVRALVERIADPSGPVRESTTLPVELVVRESAIAVGS